MAKNSENNNESEQQYEALAGGKIDSKEMIRINSLKHNVKEKLLANNDIFTSRDRDRWLKQLETAKDDTPEEIERIERQIDLEKAEIQQITGDFISKVNQDKQLFGHIKKSNKSESDQWIEAFKKKPVETKREWLKGLEDKIGELKDLYDKAKNLAPDRLEDFAGMDRHEKAAFLRELETLRQESARFEETIENNRNLFTAKEIENFKGAFNDLTAREQAEYIRAFEKNEINARKEIHEKFESFPAEYRQTFARFNFLDLSEKKLAVDKMEKELISDYQNKLFNSPLSRHLSLQSRVQALKWFTEAPNEQRGQALKLLDSQMKVEEELSTDFENLLKTMDADEDGNKIRELKEEFYNSEFQDKQKMIKTLDRELKNNGEEKNDHEKLAADYRKMLDRLVENRTISAKTAQREILRFKKLTVGKKKDDINGFAENIAPRVKLKERFEKEIPEKIRKENGDFFELGHKERMERFDTLKKLADNEEKKSIKEQDAEKKELSPEQKQKVLELKVKATTHELNGSYQEALNCYNAILMVDKEDPLAKERAQTVKAKMKERDFTTGDEGKNELKKTVEAELGTDDIKNKRRDHTIIREFSGTIRQNDQLNSQKTRAGEKTAHLSNEEGRIQAGLYRRTGMVLDGKGRATRIVKADMNKMEDMSAAEKYELQKNLREKGRDYNINFLNNNFQVTRNGDVISGNQAMEDILKKENGLKTMLENKIAAGLAAKGKDLTPAEKALLNKLIRDQDLSIDLSN